MSADETSGPGGPSPPLEVSQPLESSQSRELALAKATVEPARCRNCGAVLLGRFCVDCSQAADVHVPTTLELMHELLEGLTHSDSRLWRTLTLLWFKPGKLTQEFVAGRRAAYLPPFRLYLILSVCFFLMASFMHTRGMEVLTFDDDSGKVRAQGKPSITSCDDVNFITFARHPDWNLRIKHACNEIIRDNGENLLHVAVATMSKAMFIFLPLIAFLHMLLYWRPRYRYAEHLLFFIHLHAFYFSVAILMIAVINAAHTWPRLSGVAGFLETALGWCMPIYTLVAMRRVFQRSWAGTVFKAVVLFFVYSAVFGLTVAGVFVYAMLQL
jgi:hypothetical protein